MPLENLINGTTYYAMVRLLGPDGRESGSSNIAQFQPLAHGEFVISDNQEAPNGGFNFENELQVPGRDPRSDIYLYATTEKTGLSSPSRLGAGLRKSKFAKEGDAFGGDETIQILAGEKLVVKTRFGRAEIVVDELGKYPNVTAKLRYTFHPDKTK